MSLLIAGKALEAAVAIEQVLDRSRIHAFLLDEVEHDTGIDLARPRAHGQAVERGEAHRAFDAAAVGQRAHGGAAAEMGDDHAPAGDVGRNWPAGARRCIRRRGREIRSGARPRRRSRSGIA